VELFRCRNCAHFTFHGRGGAGLCAEGRGAHGGGHVTWATSKACGGFALRPDDCGEGVRECVRGSSSSTSARSKACWGR
jgi:hypothetical protein